MFVRERQRVGSQLCSRDMFGDMVLVRQNPPSVPISSPTPPPATFPAPCRTRTTSASNSEDLNERKKDDRRRASQLIDELLLNIYNRDNCGNLSGYTSASSSFRSQKSFQKCTELDLQENDPDEVSALLEDLKSDVVRMGSALVRKLKRRDALRRQRDAHCDVISDHLRKRAPEPADMRFSIEPAPGDSGFSQWHSAMRMVAQLPGGIPPEFRRKLWLNLADRHLSSRNVNWGKVERECFSEWSHPADAELGVQIVKDLHRTGCSLFCGEDGQENQALLKRVLLAYARWNKAVGYCQGFNMLAALILQVTEKCESEALKLMIFLIEGVLPESYFADSLRGLSVDMAVFRELLKTRLPRLSRHLDTLQTAAKDGTTSYEPPLTNVFTMQWFLTLFCNCLPQPTVLRVWDLILLEGNEILLRTALAIWQVLAERILSVRSADEFYCIMGVLTREILEFGIVDPNSLIKAIVTIGPLAELPCLREKYLYNINPWGVSASAETDMRNRQLKVYGRERLALDISALKKQYSKLKQRQRQAHIIFSAAVARQPHRNAPMVAMNHLLLGKSALVTARRIGPPKGAIPPARQAPTTLLWKDAPQRQPSSSSSSDTELCDDPEESEDVSPIPQSNSPLNGQFQDDNLIKSTSDNINLMKLDNTPDDFGSVVVDDYSIDSSVIGDSEINFDTGQIGDESAVDNNQIKNVENSDNFDTTTSTKGSGEFFDFSKYGVHSDSEDEGFDFEKFLESRVRCLKQTSVDDESIASSSEDSSEYKREHTRKNSQRALEIIQENSLILHRILQCQTRLTPSPPDQELEQSDNKVTACLPHDLSSGISEKETTTVTPDAPISPQLYYSDNFLPANTDIATRSIKYSTYENSSSPEQKYTYFDEKILTEKYENKEIISECKLSENRSDYNIEQAAFHINKPIISKYQEKTPTSTNLDFTFKFRGYTSDSPSENQNTYKASRDLFLESDALKTFYKHGEMDQPNETKSNYYDNDFDLKISNKDKSPDDDSEIRPCFTSILNSEYSRNLEEKYENLILKSSRPKFLDVAASLDKSDCGSSSYRYTTSPVNKIESPSRKSPNSESSIKKSPGDGSNFVRSPTSGRVYNPFPVNISSRQNKDVGLRLGLYKKS